MQYIPRNCHVQRDAASYTEQNKGCVIWCSSEILSASLRHKGKRNSENCIPYSQQDEDERHKHELEVVHLHFGLQVM